MSGPVLDTVEQVLSGTAAAAVTALAVRIGRAARSAASTVAGPADETKVGPMPDVGTADRIVAWRPTTFLGRLTSPTREAMLRMGTAMTFPPGARLMHVGSIEGHCYLLTSGLVKILGNDDGREPILGVRLPGDLVGEMAALTGAPRSATVAACSTVTARRIAGLELQGMMHSAPGLALEIVAMVANRLRWANERRIDYDTAPAGRRVSRVLLSLGDTLAGPSDDGRIPLTQVEIASLAGTKIATTERALRTLQRAGAVRLGYRWVAIVDREILATASATEYDTD